MQQRAHLDQTLKPHLFAFYICRSGDDRGFGDAFLHGNQAVDGGGRVNDGGLGAELVALDEKLDFIGDQIAEAAAGDFLAGEIVDRVDVGAGDQVCCSFTEANMMTFAGAPRAAAVAMVLGMIV